MEACSILKNHQEKLPIKHLLLTLKNDIASGKSFSESLRKFPQYFDDLTINLVQIGEHTGILDIMLQRISTYKEQSLRLKKQLWQALFYPVFILCFSLCMTYFMLVFIVPRFGELYTTMESTLPAFTLYVVKTGLFIKTTSGIFFIFFVFFIGGILLLKKYHPLHSDTLLLKIPFFGNLLQKNILARLTRSLSTLLHAGVPIVKAINIASHTCSNRRYVQILLMVRASVLSGQPLNQAMKKHVCFPTLMLQMIKVGEETGKLSDMLENIAVLYEEDVAHFIHTMNTLLEPLIMIILGVLIGSIVIAMYLPIFKLGNVF